MIKNSLKMWQDAEIIAKNARPISTPHGLFSNVMPLTKVLHETDFARKTIGGTDKKIRALLNSDKKQHREWKWITWEEYDKQSK